MRKIAKLCHTSNCCPEIMVDDSADPNKQVILTDDFGSKISMSREQFAVMVDLAKTGKLDKI